MKYYLILYLSFIFAATFAQQETILKGKVVTDVVFDEDINVINISNTTSTKTTKGGFYNIKAKVGDTLLFSAAQFISKKHILQKDDFSENLFFIKLHANVTQIEEIFITNTKNLSPEALGLVPKGQKQYTVGERRDRVYNTFTGVFPAAFSIDPIINAISGKGKIVKRELEVERSIGLRDYIKDTFSREYVENTLFIPFDFIDGFYFFASEDGLVKTAVSAKNINQLTFRISELANNYITIHQLNKKETPIIEVKTETIKTQEKPKNDGKKEE
jgi:hypothetical protein